MSNWILNENLQIWISQLLSLWFTVKHQQKALRFMLNCIIILKKTTLTWKMNHITFSIWSATKFLLQRKSWQHLLKQKIKKFWKFLPHKFSLTYEVELVKLIYLQRLFKPCTINIFKNLLDGKVVNLVFNIPLSNNTIVRKINYMTGDVTETTNTSDVLNFHYKWMNPLTSLDEQL